MGYYKKVEISGVNTAQLPVLSALQAKELFRRYHDGDESQRIAHRGEFASCFECD